MRNTDVHIIKLNIPKSAIYLYLNKTKERFDNMKTSIAYIIAFISVIFTSATGSFFTKKTVKTQWYDCIKPSITPPSFVFPIVWTLLYILLGFAFAKELQTNQTLIIILFSINLVLNIIWCYFYFGSKSLVLALISIFGIIGTAISIVILTPNKTTKYLLIPYIMWISFATILNTLSVIKQKKC